MTDKTDTRIQRIAAWLEPFFHQPDREISGSDEQRIFHPGFYATLPAHADSEVGDLVRTPDGVYQSKASGWALIGDASAADVTALDARVDAAEDAVDAVGAKVGSGIDAPLTGEFLKGTGAGASVWSPLDASDTASGVFSAARLGSGTANGNKYLRGDQSFQDAAFAPATNVKHKGAAGDNSADDTVAIESALTTAREIVVPGEAGEVYIVDRLDGIQSNSVLRGTGRPTIKVKAGSTSSPMLLSINAVSNVLVENIVFDGNTDNIVSFNNVVLVFNSDHVTFRHCRFQNCEGIAAFVGGTSHHITFEDCEFENCGQSVWLVSGLAADRKQALAFSGIEHPRVESTTFKDVGLDCISVAGGCSDAQLHNIDIDTNYAGSIFLSGCTTATLSGIAIKNGGGNGIDCIDSTDVTISSAIIDASRSAGVGIFDNCRGVSLAGVVCKNNFQGGVGSHQGGVTFHVTSGTLMQDVSLTGVVCYDDQGVGNVTQRYPIGVVNGGGTFKNIEIANDNILIGYDASGNPDRRVVFQASSVGLVNPKRDWRPGRDHFLASASSSIIGEMGWAVLAGGTGAGTPVSGEAGRPGIYERSTGATSGSISGIRLHATSGGVMLPADLFDFTFCFRLMDNDADVIMRVGFGADSAADPPNNGIYLEKLAADTQWFGVTRNASTQTRSAALATCDTSYHEIRIRRVNSTTIGFTLDANAEVTQATNVPTVAITPFLHVKNSAAANKRLRVDWVDPLIAGLA